MTSEHESVDDDDDDSHENEDDSVDWISNLP